MLVLTSVPLRIVLRPGVPVRAIDFISQNHVRGNLLIPFVPGSYAIWRLYPDCRVSIDGRYETVYPESTYEAVRGFFSATPGWSEFLDRFPHDIILSPRNARVEANMMQRADWAVAYEDNTDRVYVRADKRQEWQAPTPHGRDEDPVSTANKPRYPAPPVTRSDH